MCKFRLTTANTELEGENRRTGRGRGRTKKNEKQSPVLNSLQLALQDQALSQVQLPGKTTR